MFVALAASHSVATSTRSGHRSSSNALEALWLRTLGSTQLSPGRYLQGWPFAISWGVELLAAVLDEEGPQGLDGLAADFALARWVGRRGALTSTRCFSGYDRSTGRRLATVWDCVLSPPSYSALGLWSRRPRWGMWSHFSWPVSITCW